MRQQSIGRADSVSDGAKMPVERAPPVLGAHTLEVMRELGYSDDQIRALRSRRVI